MDVSQDIVDLIRDLKQAINECNLHDSDFQIDAVHVSLMVEAKRSTGGNVEFKTIGFEAGTTVASDNNSSFKFSFRPSKNDSVKLMSPRSNEIRDAIRCAVDTVTAVDAEPPTFELERCEVVLKFATTVAGKAKWFVGSDGQNTSTNTLTLVITKVNVSN
jgi:hypothetical protein